MRRRACHRSPRRPDDCRLNAPSAAERWRLAAAIGSRCRRSFRLRACCVAGEAPGNPGLCAEEIGPLAGPGAKAEIWSASLTAYLFLNFRNIAFHLTQISPIFIAIPSHSEGRFAIVTDVGTGCGGRGGGARRAALTPSSLKLRPACTKPGVAFGVDGSRTAKSCGPDAPTLASSR